MSLGVSPLTGVIGGRFFGTGVCPAFSVIALGTNGLLSCRAGRVG